MKKILFLLLAVTLSGGLSAEEMQFVTTLSQPTGSFARVESVNADSPARALQVNFCNSRISSGVVSVSGAVRAAYLKLDNSGSLGGNVPVYQLSTLNLGSGRSFEGGNVWAQEADPAAVKADGTLYGTDMKYLVAELPALEITDTANIKRGGPTGEDLEWGAQYACDYKEASGAISCTGNATYASYVLKSKGGDMREPTATCEDPDYKVNHKSECCPKEPSGDNVCYKDCDEYNWVGDQNDGSSGDYYAGSGGFSNEYPYATSLFGSNWIEAACRKGNQSWNVTCNSGVTGDCWNPQAAFPGYQIITSNEGSTQPCLRTTCSEQNENKKCIVLNGNSFQGEIVRCTYNGSKFRFYGTVMGLVCQKSTNRCPNGW